MHTRAKEVIKECYEKNKSSWGGPVFQPLTATVKLHLRATVGGTNWERAEDYLSRFLKQKHGGDEYYNATMQQIINNDPECECLYVSQSFADYVNNNYSLEELGQHISRNGNLKSISFPSNLSNSFPPDRSMYISSLFKGLVSSRSLRTISLGKRVILLDEIRSMVPFLRDSPSLDILDFDHTYMKTEGFDTLLTFLDNGSIKKLRFGGCGIENITALERCTLPSLTHLFLDFNNITSIPSLGGHAHLKILSLGHTKIDSDGFLSISRQLERDDINLSSLNLENTGLSENVELIANSLKSNTKLQYLDLGGNHFGNDGKRALLKLLIDVSSVDNTAKSNHVLLGLGSIYSGPSKTGLETYLLEKHIEDALKINRDNKDLDRTAASRTKIAHSLDMSTEVAIEGRRELFCLQGIEKYGPNPFAEMDAVFLPDALSLVGMKLSHSDFYRILAAISPDLMTLVDKRSMLEVAVKQNTTRIAALTAELAQLNIRNVEMNEQMSSLPSAQQTQPPMVADNTVGRKRGRISGEDDA